MRPLRSAALTAAALGCCLAVPLSAHAATKTVSMGPPGKTADALHKYQSDVDAFFPTSVTIHPGDKVRFVPASFHTVDLPKKGGTRIPFLVQDKVIANAVDEAGAAFWFNGEKNLAFNPVLFKNLYGKTATYTGAAAVDTGLPIQDKPKPVTITFPKAGDYTFYCDVHAGMKGTVHVRRGGRLLSPRQEAARVRKQLAHALKVAKAFKTDQAPTNTMRVGLTGGSGIEYYGFVPAKLTVPVGTTLNFDIPNGLQEPHTVTVGPGNPEKEPKSYLGVLAASMESPNFDPRAVFASDAPSGPQTVTPSSHGNGFWNSGVLDSDKATPLPQTSHVTFAEPGTYQIYCMIHPFMHATVTVG